MRKIYSKIFGVAIIITILIASGCDQSLNTEPDKKQKIKPIPVATATPTTANDGLTEFDNSGFSATDYVTAGVGTNSGNEETISVDVPSGATVERVYLYWSRRGSETNPAASEIEVNGIIRTGNIVGGPVDTPDDRGSAITHRVDLTGTVGIVPGTNTLTVKDVKKDKVTEPLGASVLVFYSNASDGESELILYDGVDFLYRFAENEALRKAVPITFNFTPKGASREAELTLFIGDIEVGGPDRPNSLEIEVGGTTTVIGDDEADPFGSFDGAEWDNYTKPITIPAGVDHVTVYPVSGPGDNPASLVWSLAGLSVPVPQERGGGQGCTPGYWKQSQHFDSWVNHAPSDDLTDTFGSNDYPLAKPEKGTAGALDLLQGLQLRGGKVNALTRHAVAALLNASNPDVSYDLTVSEVKSKFNDAVEDGGKKVIEAAKDEFADFNEQGCPLN